MLKLNQILTLLAVLLFLSVADQANATTTSQLSENIRIKSKVLDHSLQYRVYTPAGIKNTDKVPTI